VTYKVPADQQDLLCSGPFPGGASWIAATPFDPGSSPALAAAAALGSGGAGWACPPAASGLPGVCTPFGNPNAGVTSFDNILWAWLTIFQVVSQEGWTDVLYATQDAVGDWVWVYYLLLLLLGSFFVCNLAIAVLYVHFTREAGGKPPARGSSNAELAGRGPSAAASGCSLPLAGERQGALLCAGQERAAAEALGRAGPPPVMLVEAFAEEEGAEQQQWLAGLSHQQGFDDGLLQSLKSARPGSRSQAVLRDSSAQVAGQPGGRNLWGKLRLGCYHLHASR
jgi:hypothetical protein